MNTETTQSEYLASWEGLTLEQVKANSQEIDTVRARCLGSLCAAMFYSLQSLRSIKYYSEHEVSHGMIAKKAEEELERLSKIVEETNEMYRRINGENLLEIPQW